MLCLVGLAAQSLRADVLDVYIAAGQSNMDGRGQASELTGDLEQYSSPLPQTLINYTNPADPHNSGSVLRETGWVALAPGYAVPPGFSGNLPSSRFGPEVSFAHQMTSRTTERRVAVIKVARGGTNLFGDWDPSDGVNGPKGFMFESFEVAVPKALQSLSDMGHSFEVRGMIWHQGEADGSLSQATYETNLTEFINVVRSKLSLPNLPFLIGELESVDGGREAVRTAQANVAAAMDFVEFVPSEGLTVYDGTHFTAASQIELGLRFATAMQSSISTPLGDYNRDGLVDQSDYYVWRSDYGLTTHARSDGNKDGVVNAADYTVWRDNLGATSEPDLAAEPTGSDDYPEGVVDALDYDEGRSKSGATQPPQATSAETSVPEPSASVLVGLLAMGLLKRRTDS